MDPVSAAMLAAGGASLAGGIWSNITNLGESKRARQFAERMSGTAYQRAVVDMRAAGINPMLAYMQGGASTPGAPTANVEDALSPAVSSVQHSRRLHEELGLMKDQAAKVRSEEINVRRAGAIQEIEARKHEQEIRESVAREKNISASTALSLADLPGRTVAGQVAGGRFGKVTEYIRRGLGTLTPVAGLVGAAAIGRFSGSTARGVGGSFGGIGGPRGLAPRLKGSESGRGPDYYDLWRNTYTRGGR